MKKQGQFIKLLILVTLALATIFLSSCNLPARIVSLLTSGSGMSQEECLEDFKKENEQRIIDHFKENEEIFNKVAESLNAFIAGADDIDSYRTISLGSFPTFDENHEPVHRYMLFTVRQPDPDSNERVREYLDFLNDKSINIFKLTSDELEKFLTGEDYDYNSRQVRYTEASCVSLEDPNYRGNSIMFPSTIIGMYNRADRVEASLWYSKSAVKSDNPDRINEHWSITYSVYWAHAI